MFAVLSTLTLGTTQEPATSASTTAAWSYERSGHLQEYRLLSAVELPDPRNLFRGSPARNRSLLWRAHLAIQLVKHPEFSQEQVRIILDAISLSTPEFFTASNDSGKKIKADEALQLLKRRVVRAFPNNQASELFAGIAGGKVEDDILTMYYDISALPLKKRKASFSNATPNKKSELWRTHLAFFLVKRPNLDEWQTQVILSAMSLATPEYFAVQSGDAAWKAKVQEPSRTLEAQIINAFSWEDAAKIFATLGDDVQSAKSSASVLLRSISYIPLSDHGPYMQWTHSRFLAQDMAVEGGSCQCSTESDWCPISGYCNGSNCNPTQSGCGTLWSYPCNGASCR